VISFVWEPGIELPAGTGGSENYTTGQVRELNRRGVEAQVVTVGLGTSDGREGFPGVPFHDLETADAVSRLDGTVVFVTDFPAVPTQRPGFPMLHGPPPLGESARERRRAQLLDRSLIATSSFAAALWADFLDVDIATVAIVYPFAESCFATVPRHDSDPAQVRILYAGRLSPEKGIYTLLATLHSEHLVADSRLVFTATAAGDDKPQGAIIRMLLEAHPGIALVGSRRTPEAMAELMTDQDIVLIPSNGQYWHETFGIVSIEAQHAGCRVIASDDGGLPETDCGALTLVPADDADALARTIVRVVGLGPTSTRVRAQAAARFTVAASVDRLIEVLSAPASITPARVVAELEHLATLTSPTNEVRRPELDPR
jgi:glycosyltransferase involved in cell wall biosynthesis